MPFNSKSRIIRQLAGQKSIGGAQHALVEEDFIDIEVKNVSEGLIEQVDQIIAGEKDVLPGMPLPSLSAFENQDQFVHRSIVLRCGYTAPPDLIFLLFETNQPANQYLAI